MPKAGARAELPCVAPAGKQPSAFVPIIAPASSKRNTEGDDLFGKYRAPCKNKSIINT